MTKKSFKKEKKGNEETWEWEETPEVTAALERLHRDIRIIDNEVTDEPS